MRRADRNDCSGRPLPLTKVTIMSTVCCKFGFADSDNHQGYTYRATEKASNGVACYSFCDDYEALAACVAQPSNLVSVEFEAWFDDAGWVACESPAVCAEFAKLGRKSKPAASS